MHRHQSTLFVTGTILVVAGLVYSSSGYQRNASWAQLGEGITWGAAIGAEPGPDGTIYVFHRAQPPLLAFTPSGRLLRSWGRDMFVFPHGLHVDRQGNVWVTDAQGRDGKGHQVFKFSSDGTLLLTLGKAGVAGAGPDTFTQPTDVVTAPNGDIFVTEGHTTGTGHHRVVKLSKDGTFIKAWGGRKGSGPGEFDDPHGIEIDSRGRLFVADRGNKRIQIFDQDGRYLDQWTQFGVPSGMYITANDTLYVTDNQSWQADGKGLRKGIRIGSVTDGKVTDFIEDVESLKEEHTGGEGVGADAAGNVYAAVVNRKIVEKHVKQ